jgi:hypothetical protein
MWHTWATIDMPAHLFEPEKKLPRNGSSTKNTCHRHSNELWTPAHSIKIVLISIIKFYTFILKFYIFIKYIAIILVIYSYLYWFKVLLSQKQLCINRVLGMKYWKCHIRDSTFYSNLKKFLGGEIPPELHLQMASHACRSLHLGSYV